LDFNQHAHKQTLEEDTGSIPLQPAAWSPKPPKLRDLQELSWGFWTPRGSVTPHRLKSVQQPAKASDTGVAARWSAHETDPPDSLTRTLL